MEYLLIHLIMRFFDLIINILLLLNLNMIELFFDTETENIIPRNIHPKHFEKYEKARLVTIAWCLRDENNIYSQHYAIVKNNIEEREIGAEFIHGINREMVDKFGKPLESVLDMFMKDVQICERIVCHNIEFDMKIVASELFRLGRDYDAENVLLCDSFCTMKESTNIVKIPSKFGTSYKWPKLVELHNFLFGRGFDGEHNAQSDNVALINCYYKLKNKIDLE